VKKSGTIETAKRPAKPSRSPGPEAEDDNRATYDVKRLRQTRVDRMSEDEAATIDMSELMADVEPLDGNDDERQ
jgi:hypothetical protein